MRLAVFLPSLRRFSKLDKGRFRKYCVRDVSDGGVCVCPGWQRLRQHKTLE